MSNNNKTITESLVQLRDDLKTWSINRLNTKANANHIHTDYDNAINELNEEVSIDYTRIQFDTNSITTEEGLDPTTYQTKIDANLSTTDKTVVGAINELSEEIVDLNNQLNGGEGGYTNLADPASADWLTNSRFATSSIATAEGGVITNRISCKLGDTVRVKGLNLNTVIGGSYARVRMYTGTTITDSGSTTANGLIGSGNGSNESGDVTTLVLATGTNANINGDLTSKTFDNIRLNGTLIDGYTANDVIITVNEEIVGKSSQGYSDRILTLENTVTNHEARLKLLETETDTGVNIDNDNIPDYWVDELETKADAIQVAMEKAGRNKSAFLWYTDAHWVNGNSKKSPMLLDYLYMNTPMNKVIFGGDIIGDTLLATREEMKYLYEWRKAIKDLPNHHSVFGNHDMFDLDSVDYENDNYRYSFLLAPEETPDQVWGNGNYYYIDNPSEKTRYLYIAYMTSDHTKMMEQGQFICDSIKSVEDGWHIVAIAHRWWQYSSSSTPTTGSIPTYETEILDVFDKYNARTTRSGSNYFTAQDFTSGKGKVEFCIGGHIHVDYDIFSNGGIPIIITTADANQNRVPDSTVDSGTVGTTTESAVFGIIADYNEEVTKINVVGVGRGTSRVVRASTSVPTSITNITYSGDTTVESAIDKAKFLFTVNYSDGSSSTINGASSVTPTTITTVGDNTVTITYVENGITLSGTATIVGTAKPVVNLLNLNRPLVTGTSGENIGVNHELDKAYTNTNYGGTYANNACTVSNLTENSITVKEPGIGGTCVAYPVEVDLANKSYKLSFDYAGQGSGKARVYWRGFYETGLLTGTNTAVDSASGGSGHIDCEIPRTGGCIGVIIFFGSNTGQTASYTNVSLTEV